MNISDGERSYFCWRIINGVDIKGSGGESVSAISISDDVTEVDGAVEVLIWSKGVLISCLIKGDGTVACIDGLNGEVL